MKLFPLIGPLLVEGGKIKYLNANPNGREDLLVTPLQAKVMESKGYGKVPDQFIYQAGPKEEEELHKELVKKFGEDYEETLDNRPDKGFQGYSSVDGVLGGTWRILRDIHGMWHIPAYYAPSQGWEAKSINVDFWGDQANVLLSGEAFIAKVQEEWQRATCLEIDFFADQATTLQFFDDLDTDPLFDTNNGAFIHPNFEDPSNRAFMNKLEAINGDGCWSYVGRVSMTQQISFIDTWCAGSVNSALHEMMHAMGFHHEQSRYDRDGSLYLDGDVCNNDDWFYWLRLKLSKSNWAQMYHPLGKYHDHTSIMHYGSWVCSAPDGSNTIDGSLTSPDGKDWRRYGMLTNDGYDVPTGRNSKNRFRISDLIQINEAYNCNDRSNDHYFQTFMLYCDSGAAVGHLDMYPVGWKCDGYSDCTDGSDEQNCNIVQKDGTGGTLGNGLGSLASGDWVNLGALKAMTAGIRNDHEGNPEYPCSRYGYNIVNDGGGVKCECLPGFGDGTNFGSGVDIAAGGNCDTPDPSLCAGDPCSGISGSTCTPDVTVNDGFTCCPNSANTEYRVNDAGNACEEIDRCAEGTHFCMSSGYGGLCTWTTNVGYTCSCGVGYEGTGCSYRAFVEGEGECDVNWDAPVGSHGSTSTYPYYATCHAVDTCATEQDDCVNIATCNNLTEKFGFGLFGTYSCTCPNGEAGDGKASGTQCGESPCFDGTHTCDTTDNDGDAITACVPIDSDNHDCACPADTHYGDANDGGSGCTKKVNECTDGSHTCDIAGGQDCVDTDESFTCECIMQYAPEYGYEQTGSHETNDLNCINVNECSTLAQPCAPRNSFCTDDSPTADECVDFTSKYCDNELLGYDGTCPVNTACNTHTCECDSNFKETSYASFVDGEFYDYPGTICNDPKDFDNCNAASGTCADPFCAHDCVDASCVDTGEIFFLADSESYASGFICDCRAVGKYGNGRGTACVTASCPTNAVVTDADVGVFHSDSFPNVIEDFQCVCDAGFFDSSDGSDNKAPVCLVDPCFTDNGGCGDNAECVTVDENTVTCNCFSGFHDIGSGCEDINECDDPSTCNENDTCQNNDGGFECIEPLDCKCDFGFVDGLIVNTNNGNPFPIVNSCDSVASGKASEPWTAFCDENGNGVLDGGEESTSFVMQKKCKKIISGAAQLNCGDGDVVVPPVECNCSSKPKDCPECDAECIGKSGKNVEIKYTCPDGSDNAGASINITGKCKKIGKLDSNLACSGGGGGGGGGGGEECKCESQVNAIVSGIGGSAAAVCIEADKKKPKWQFFCDENENGEHDGGENKQEVAQKCKKICKSSFTYM